MNRRKTATETPRARCSEELDSTVHRLSSVSHGNCARQMRTGDHGAGGGREFARRYIKWNVIHFTTNSRRNQPKSEPGQIPTIRNVGFVPGLSFWMEHFFTRPFQRREAYLYDGAPGSFWVSGIQLSPVERSYTRVQTRLARARLWVTAMRPMFWAAASSKILFQIWAGDHVQHGADFIADQKICPAHQGPCHAKALELPAGQLPGEPVQPRQFQWPKEARTSGRSFPLSSRTCFRRHRGLMAFSGCWQIS